MEIPITQFRREIFTRVNQALQGKEVWVVHKGQRFKLVPEAGSGSRLSRITPMEVISATQPGSLVSSDRSLQEEMTRAWEQDWSNL